MTPQEKTGFNMVHFFLLLLRLLVCKTVAKHAFKHAYRDQDFQLCRE
jgi:hypothetical protein